MDSLSLLNTAIGLASAIGAIALFRLNSALRNKAHAELLEKFETALSIKQKHSVCELFFLLHGLRMNYKDVVSIVNDDNSSKIIRALRKSPGMVKYDNNGFQYNNFYKKSWFRKLGNVSSKFLMYGFLTIDILLLIGIAFSKGETTLQLLFSAIFISVFFTMQLNENQHDRLVHDLVSANRLSQMN